MKLQGEGAKFLSKLPYMYVGCIKLHSVWRLNRNLFGIFNVIGVICEQILKFYNRSSWAFNGNCNGQTSTL